MFFLKNINHEHEKSKLMTAIFVVNSIVDKASWHIGTPYVRFEILRINT